MGIAIAGKIPSGVAIAGQKPAGLAISGEVVSQAIKWSLLSSVTMGNTGISAPIDTTGAKLLIVFSFLNGSTVPSITDNAGNTWTLGISQLGQFSCIIHYVINPNTSTSHTFNLSGVTYSQFLIAAFDGPDALSVDQTTTASTTDASSVQFPPFTPSVASSLVLSAVAQHTNVLAAINSGFTHIAQIAAGGTPVGGSAAYLSQGSSATIAPTWTAGTFPYPGLYAAMISFKPS